MAKKLNKTSTAAAKKTSKQAKRGATRAAATSAPRRPRAAATAHAAQESRIPAPGTTLQKLDRHGRLRCECTIEADGIRYDGKLYRSLSGAAMAAAADLGLQNKTQNGFTFWGLTKPGGADPLDALARAWTRYHAHAESIATRGGTDGLAAATAALTAHAEALTALRDRAAEAQG